MDFDPALHYRHSIRLRGFDYSEPGCYFVTTCTRDRLPLFGQIRDAEMHLNDVGRMVESVWNGLPRHYPGVDIDAFVVMPNHIHGIVILTRTGRARGPAPTKAGTVRAETGTRLSLPDVVHRFKSSTTALHRNGASQGKWPGIHGPVWQRNYFEHIIRPGKEINIIQGYIYENPKRWEFDRENPKATNPETEDPWL